MYVPEWDGAFPSLGFQVAAHIETYLKVELLREQAEQLVHYYRLDPETGLRVVRRARLRRSKGWGKSPFGGMIAFAELTGPVVFSHWGDGLPIGALHPDPWVQLAAVSESQTTNVLLWLFDTLADLPETQVELGIDLGRTRIYLHGRKGRIEPVTAAAGSREGQRISFGVLDQSEAWFQHNGGTRLADTLRRNAGKVNGWTLELQNAPAQGDGSVAAATEEASRIRQPGVYFNTRAGPDVADLKDRPAVLASLKIAYEDAALDRGGWVNLDRLADECADTATDPSDARRYFLNIVSVATQQAFDPKVWTLRANEHVVPDGARITLGFDGARFRDATALIGCEIETGHLFTLGIWERPENAEDDWQVDEAAVDAVLNAAFKRYDVWRLYADPPYWESTVAKWAAEYGEKQVISWWTNRTKMMAYAVQAFASAMRAGDFTHDNNADLTRHITNAARAR